MTAARPNLARRPFVDSRPANVAAALLLVSAVALTAISVRTVHAYREGSRKSREEIAALRVEIGRLEASRREAGQKLARFDLPGIHAGAEEANALARLRSFSWSRFLTRLEKSLPNDVRVDSISLQRDKRTSGEAGPAGEEAFAVTLSVVSRDPDGLPRLIRAFYESPWFDQPTPRTEAGGEQGSVEGRRLGLEVLYRDSGVKP